MRNIVTGLTLVVLLGCGSSPAPETPHPFASASASAAPRAQGSSESRSGPPDTPMRDVVDTYFGVQVHDPYRWLEAQEDPEVKTWMKAQADYARRTLDGLNHQKELLERVTALNQDTVSVPAAEMWGGQVFYKKAAPGKDQLSLWVRSTQPGSSERMLIDAGGLSTPTQAATIDKFYPSPNGQYVAYGVSLAGSEDLTLRVVETASGKVLSEAIDRTSFVFVSWLDEKRFLYNRLPPLAAGAPESERYKRTRVYVHTVGTDPSQDVAVFGWKVASEIAVPEDDFSDAVVFEGGDLVVIRTGGGVSREYDVYVAKRTELNGANTKWKKVYSAAEHAVTDIAVVGQDMYLLTHQGAAHFKVLKTSLKKPDFQTAEVVIPESQVILKALALAKDALYVQGLDRGEGRLFAVPIGDKRVGSKTPGVNSRFVQLALPERGPIRTLTADPKARGVMFQQRSWTHAQTWQTAAMGDAKPTDLGLVPASPADFSSIVEDHLTAVSADGTKVPLTVLYRRDLKKDGKNPVWLDAYGAYGYSNDPWFDPTRLAWLERGGVFAVCHVRGGGELGEDWHLAGAKANKQRGVEDDIACAEHLISQGFTSKAHLGAAGASAGGLIVGKVISDRPDLFAAAVIEVGLADTLRMELEVSGPANVPEFGSVKVEEQFRWLYASSPYAAVKDGVDYPAVLLTAGMRDARVSPWQPAKFAARLQRASTSKKPVLLRVDYEGGHHALLVSKAQYSRDMADMYTFMFAQTAGGADR
ncbi:MAG: S9 family peptidase [Polyangiaceae bacterium]|nr:S9 family peptidase [Polyangiaceae bacterium]